MIQKTPRVVFDGYCYDWRVDIDPEKRDSLVGHGPEKHPGEPYFEWFRMVLSRARPKKDEDWD